MLLLSLPASARFDIPSAGAIRVAAALALLLATACGDGRTAARDGGDPPGFVAQLARRDAPVPRTSAPRLSVPQAYAPCGPSTPARCDAAGSLPDTRVTRAMALAGAASSAPGATGDALHATALATLLWKRDAGNALDTAISYLRSAARASERPSDLLTDLSAAYLLRAERTAGDPRDLFQAIEAADSARRIGGGAGEAAQFNLALALESLGLPAQATLASENYLRMDATSGWAREARAQLERSRPRLRVRPPAEHARDDSLRAFARTTPQDARTLGFDHWLGAWGDSLLHGRADEAATLLHAATVIGDAIAATGGDRSLRDATAAVASVRGTAMERRLARAHSLYSRGQAAAADTRHADAARLFAQVLATPDVPRSLALWATLGRATALVYGGGAAERERLIAAAERLADSTEYPSALGRASWIRGTLALREGRYERAIDHYHGARALFARAGETENAGAVRYLAGEAALSLGDRDTGYRELVGALETLRPFRPSLWMHNALIVMSRALEGDGLPLAALHLSNEDVDVAEHLDVALRLPLAPPIYQAEAIVARARLLARLQPESLAVNLDRAGALLRAAPNVFARDWVGAQLSFARASMLVDRAPGQAVELLGGVIAAFDGNNAQHARNAARHLAALVLRARARAAAGDASGATTDLRTAVALIETERAAISREGNREALADATRDVLDTLVSLRLAAGDTVGALVVSERGRSPVEVGALQLHARSGEVTVVLRLVGDRLLAWTVGERPRSVRLAVSAVNGADLAFRIRRVRAALERRADARATMADLSFLYEALIRPIAARFASGRVAIVPDGELAAVPYAALYDARNGQYLVQAYALRVESSLRDAVASERESAAVAGATVVIADPAFDTAANRGVSRLSGAAEEAAAIARIYGGGARVVAGADATASAVRRALANASVVHYAGHAVADERRPERSYLLLAREAGRAGAGSVRAGTGTAGAGRLNDRLTASDIRAMSLSRLRLVVLAACETLGLATEKSTGFRGIASALRGAGARGVIGSLWRVDDASAAALTVEVHRAYARTHDAASALRDAQLHLLGGGSPILAAPSAWAGFQFTGH